jgi:GntP family gluconate:H+ symporter
MTPLGILIVALVVVVGGVLAFRLHPFLILIIAAFVVALLTPNGDASLAAPGQRVAEGFGKTALDIGIVIAMASILGTCLSAAGGAQRIVVSIQHLVGERRTPLALLLAGFVLGIPMFAETVFYLLLPLARAAWDRTGRHYLLCVLSIVAGATMTHSLVPPTPGPLFVADALNVDMATMIGVGSIVGLIAALAGYAYARWADQKWPLQPKRAGHAADTGDEHDPADETPPPAAPATLPPLWAALLPILLPVVLISLESVSQSAPAMFSPTALSAIRLVGEKNVALSLAALAAILVLYRAGGGMPAVRRTIAEAVTEAGGIILVIAAGGALGGALRQAGLAQLSAGLATGAGIAVIPIAWLVTAIIRAAQGSATVAMITAAGVMAPIVLDGSHAFHPVYIAVAIGCGSKIGMWMNDSGFWVISRMSGMSETQTLRSASVMVFVEGTVGLIATLALALAWPMR